MLHIQLEFTFTKNETLQQSRKIAFDNYTNTVVF